SGCSGCRCAWARSAAATGELAAQGVLRQSQLRLQAPQHQVVETLEQGLQVVRSGARLRMALEAKRRLLPEGDALERSVEQRAVGRLHARGQGGLIDGEAVILAGDEHAAGLQLLHRVIGTMVAELHFDGARARGEAEDLVPETDA